MSDRSQELKQQIAGLEAQLADLKRRLPAHSLPPAMMAEIDDLDEQLAQARIALERELHKQG